MKEIAELLVRENIVQVDFEKKFQWTSGIISPIYCDCRELIGIPTAYEVIAEAMVKKISQLPSPPQILAGTATAGIPWAAFVAQKMNLPMLYVRSKPKGHGAGKQVEGRAEKNQAIVVVEDAFSTAGSSAASVLALRSELDAVCDTVIGIFSWSTPRILEYKKKHGINFLPLTTFEEIVEALAKAKKITPEEKKSLESFHQNPKKWHESTQF